MAITYGCCIIKRSDMLKFKNVVTDKSRFIVLDDIEATDIDNELDFKIAEYLFKIKIKLIFYIKRDMYYIFLGSSVGRAVDC